MKTSISHYTLLLNIIVQKNLVISYFYLQLNLNFFYIKSYCTICFDNIRCQFHFHVFINTDSYFSLPPLILMIVCVVFCILYVVLKSFIIFNHININFGPSSSVFFLIIQSNFRKYMYISPFTVKIIYESTSFTPDMN